MADDNMKFWDKLKTPPKAAIKTIGAGRIKGKSDINPQWRYEIMTEIFGACGNGWKYSIERLWTEPSFDGQVFAFAQVKVEYQTGDGWSMPIQGIGGSMLIIKEKAGLYSNKEAFKMATTDALGTALRMIGVASTVYRGLWDGNIEPKNETMPPNKLDKNQQEFLNFVCNSLVLPDNYIVDMKNVKASIINELKGKDFPTDIKRANKLIPLLTDKYSKVIFKIDPEKDEIPY